MDPCVDLDPESMIGLDLAVADVIRDHIEKSALQSKSNLSFWLRNDFPPRAAGEIFDQIVADIAHGGGEIFDSLIDVSTQDACIESYVTKTMVNVRDYVIGIFDESVADGVDSLVASFVLQKVTKELAERLETI